MLTLYNESFFSEGNGAQGSHSKDDWQDLVSLDQIQHGGEDLQIAFMFSKLKVFCASFIFFCL